MRHQRAIFWLSFNLESVVFVAYCSRLIFFCIVCIDSYFSLLDFVGSIPDFFISILQLFFTKFAIFNTSFPRRSTVNQVYL